MRAEGGIAERADRIVAILITTGLGALFDVPVLMFVAIWALAIANTVTVIQRILMVRKQALADAAPS
jgi:CDP-diacylglycerol--glycerol-3-phosphate 3-phosphatidyltransferase/CDP-diacylglycerol--inositol 3-phosphatidyltransferase